MLCKNLLLKELRIQNYNRIIIGHLKINSLRNKVEFLSDQNCMVSVFFRVSQNVNLKNLKNSFFELIISKMKVGY